MAREKFDLIVFDWDGTLMDSTAAIAYAIQRVAEDLKMPVPDAKKASFVIGLGLLEAVRFIMPDLPLELQSKAIGLYRRYYLQESKKLTLFDGVKEMLADLSFRGYTLAVATGKSRVGLNYDLKRSGLWDYFESSRCADETFSKPHPAMLQELMAELGKDAERTVMIGDTTHDLQMAKNAETKAIAVEYGAHPKNLLGELNPIYSADSVTALHDWLIKNA